MAKIDKIQEVAVDELVLYERNAKLHPESQIDLICRSIQEFGFLNPCLIDKGRNVIAGHGRVEAAKRLDMKTVPCVYVEGLSEAQRRAYILADNRLTELGEWDMDLVMSELEELEEIDFDIELTGFDVDLHQDEGSAFREQDEIDLDEEPNSKECECPSCGFRFVP